MIYAAGILFLAPGDKALFLKRGPGGDHPGEWCFPGGTTEGDETPEQTAEREALEELGSFPKGPRAQLTRTVSALALLAPNMPPAVGSPSPGLAVAETGQQVAFTTFLQKTKDQFVPQLDGEHVGYAWAPVTEPPEPLHPGCRVALRRLTMDELGVARAIAAGELASPQRYMNVTLFALRITGTGAAYRRSLDEFVWRDPEVYLNPEFLARAAGLPVIMEHPKGATLTSKEFEDRIVGTVMLPYIRGNEVWGVAKIYDADAIRAMTEDDLSTSPAVVFRGPDLTNKIELEDGSKLLIEGKPSLLDHVAIVPKGVWDKGGEPTGVATEARGDSDMPEKTKEEIEAQARKDADEAKVKADADAGTKLDKLLSHVDAMMGTMDSLGKRMDAFDAKCDAMGTRMDSMGKKADADDKKDEKEEDKKADKKADGESDDKKDKKADADEKDEKEEKEEKKADSDEARADAAELSSIKAELASLRATVTRVDLTDAELDQFAETQARADSVFNQFGLRAPRPLVGEGLGTYRRRLVTKLQPHSPAWKEVRLSAIADDVAFGVAEKQIYADAETAAHNPTDVKDGELRAVTSTDRETGRSMTSFYGPQTFIKGMSRPSDRVTKINLQQV